METVEKRTSRHRFLRQLAMGLGAGLGVLAVPAVAKAEVFVCCPALPGQCPQDCSGGHVRYFCQCSRFGFPPDYCTDCQPDDECYNGPC